MVHNLLWTGGFDSTFRLCQLAREKCTVQPIYLQSKIRPSTHFELEAQDNILKWLATKNILATILPVRIVNIDSYYVPNDYKEDFDALHKLYKLGSQYYKMAYFCASEFPCELGHENFVHRPGALGRMLLEKGHFCYDENHNYKLDEKLTDSLVYKFFGHYYFPIIQYNNLQMLDLLKSWDMLDMLSYIRFCDSNTKENCGFCVSCMPKVTISTEYFKFSKEALKQYEICKLLKRIDESNDLYSLYYDYKFDKVIAMFRLEHFKNIKFNIFKTFDYLNSLTLKQIKKQANRVNTYDDFVKVFCIK